MESLKFIFAGGEGDVWDSQGKIVLSPQLSQAELKRLHDIKHPSVIAIQQVAEKKK